MKLARKDFQSDQEVRWCPGCGDYGILAAIQFMLPDTGIKPEELVFVSGIGCAARLPYYMNTYGLHGIHGRAPAIATGVALARPDLHVWVIGGDGDMLSIGGNHLIHALRRNVNIKILMLNNQIYGLTKGQYSPTSELGKVTKSTPFGSLDQPFNPISVALGAEASFVARTHDMDRKHMIEMFQRANEHRGASFIEIYQNCNVFNDGAFDTILNKDARPNMLIELKHGEPVRFGVDRELGVTMNEFGEAVIVRVDEVGEDRIVVHDERRPDPTLAFALVAAGRPTDHPDPGRRVPCDRPPELRGRDAAAAGGCVGQGWPGRPRRSAPFRADLVGLLARTSPPARAQSSVRNTMPVRGFGLKNVVFCGMRARSTAAARVWATVTGEQRIAALALPLSTAAAVAAASWRYCHDAPGSRGTTRASTSAASVAATAGCSPASAAGAHLRAGDREREAASVDEAEPALRAHAVGERVDVLGRDRSRVGDRERVGERGPEVDARGQVDEAVDRLDPQLVVDELHDEAHDRRRAGIVDPLRAALGAVVQRGLEAVMAVGQHERRPADDAASPRRRCRGRRSRPVRAARRSRRCTTRAVSRGRAARSGPRRGSGPRSGRRSPASPAGARAGPTSPSAASVRAGGCRRRRLRAGRARR